MRFSPASSASSTFANRRAAGVALAAAVSDLDLEPPVIVLALPRGGVPVASEVAKALRAPLDLLVVRKIGMPGHPELAIGAIATGGVVVHEPSAGNYIASLDTSFGRLVEAAQRELLRREHAYRDHLPPLDLAGRTAVLVDDGIATGSTMLAAVRAARRAHARRVVVAVPVASPEAQPLLAHEADEVVILRIPRNLRAVGEWYDDFHQLEDADVRALLGSAA
jgi:putative phosphoribosyl transferase